MPEPIQPENLLDVLTFRIADPGTFVHRKLSISGMPLETVPRWTARAVAAGLTDGTLGYVPAAQRLDPDEHQTVVDFLKAYIRLCGSRLPDDHRIHAILAKLTAPAPVPGSSRRAQECSQACTEGHQYDETCELGSSRRAQEPEPLHVDARTDALAEEVAQYAWPEPASAGCGPDCSEGHTYMAGCAIKPPARAFIGEPPCGNPDCPCGVI